MKNIWGICAIALALAGCAGPQMQRGYDSQPNVVTLPALNSEASAEVGQTIISKANVTKVPAIVLSSTVSELFLAHAVMTVPAGTLSLATADANGKFYIAPNATMLSHLDIFRITRRADSTGIYVPNDRTKPAVIAVGESYGKIPVTDIKHTTAEKWHADGFKRELVYSGVSQKTISILYREFQNDMARPAFSQDLKYDLSQGKEIGFKGARFEVISANNTGITYKVLKALD